MIGDLQNQVKDQKELVVRLEEDLVAAQSSQVAVKVKVPHQAGGKDPLMSGFEQVRLWTKRPFSVV